MGRERGGGGGEDDEGMVINKILGFGNGVLIENPPSMIGFPPLVTHNPWPYKGNLMKFARLHMELRVH